MDIKDLYINEKEMILLQNKEKENWLFWKEKNWLRRKRENICKRKIIMNSYSLKIVTSIPADYIAWFY